MKFNIDRPPADVRKRDKLSAKREWHQKFAWLPTTVDETENSHSKVWFEKYWRRGHWGPSRRGESSSMRFTKFSEKEYFKKKLRGYFDEEKGEPDTDTNVGIGSLTMVSIKCPKKDGEHDTNKYKKITGKVTRDPKEEKGEEL